jgi:hypothetical protein
VEQFVFLFSVDATTSRMCREGPVLSSKLARARALSRCR